MVASSQPDPTRSKAELRDTLKERRSLIGEVERQELSTRAADRFCSWLLTHGVKNVGLFASIRDEIDTAPLFEALRRQGVDVALPKIVDGARELQFGFVADWTQLVRGRYHIREPLEANVAIETLEAVVVPGLGFDAVGGRLGYGAGWYDRTLMSYRGWVVGFGFDVQVVEEVPMESHDRRLDLVVTDERTLVADTR